MNEREADSRSPLTDTKGPDSFSTVFIDVVIFSVIYCNISSFRNNGWHSTVLEFGVSVKHLLYPMASLWQDEIVQECLRVFRREFPHQQLNKSKMWTILAGLVLTHTLDAQWKRVVSLSTGLKCLTPRKIDQPPDGLQILDSHAEVLCRRGFILYEIHNKW